jgi:hypothetical protein
MSSLSLCYELSEYADANAVSAQNIMADLPKQTAKLHMAFGLLLILGTLCS